MKNFAGRFVNQPGNAAIEYGLIAVLVAVAILAAARVVGTENGGTIDNLVAEVQSSRN